MSEIVNEFYESWTNAQSDYDQTWLVDQHWRRSIVAFGKRGLSADDITEAVSITAEREDVDPEERWVYFCGVCWNMVRGAEKVSLH